MLIGGLIKLSLVDYPRHTAAVVFTQGCNFRCHYCHNRELVLPKCFQPAISEAEVFAFLEKRRGLLQAVVISGGEPTQQNDLKSFIERCRSLEYRIKLDTNGSRPEVLRDLLSAGLLDCVALDYKAPLATYHQICGLKVDTTRIQDSLELIKHESRTGFEYQIRTTLVKGWHSKAGLELMHKELDSARSWRLQNYIHRDTVLHPQFSENEQFSIAEMNNFRELFEVHPHL